MQYTNTLRPISHPAGTAVALGFFDGVHLGHRAVIECAVTYARAHGLAPAVFTFSLPAGSPIKGGQILPLSLKHQRIEALGVEHYFAPAFEEFRALTPEQFVQDALAGAFGAKAVFCGDNFTFGKNKAGNVALLERLGAELGIQVCQVPMAQYGQQLVSSTRIRAALRAGHMEEVQALLGAPYAIDFAVQHGQGLGRTLGVPTLNQIYPAGCELPAHGFYISRVWLNGCWHPSATGIGSRPTVNQDETQVTCETFIPDFSAQLYGQTPLVELHQFLAPSQKFESLDQLRAAIVQAGQQAQAYFAAKTL